jgi:hypothetical protein
MQRLGPERLNKSRKNSKIAQIILKKLINGNSKENQKKQIEIN